MPRNLEGASSVSVLHHQHLTSMLLLLLLLLPPPPLLLLLLLLCPHFVTGADACR
jgi:hypothetical protein